MVAVEFDGVEVAGVVLVELDDLELAGVVVVELDDDPDDVEGVAEP